MLKTFELYYKGVSNCTCAYPSPLDSSFELFSSSIVSVQPLLLAALSGSLYSCVSTIWSSVFNGTG